jgi:hypothetical protein
MVVWLPNKSAKVVGDALKTTIEFNTPGETRLNSLRTDAGTEFFNAYADRVVYKPLGVNHYRAQKEPGASVVERFNQTLGRVIAKYITANPKTTQGHLRQLLPHFVQSYNSTRHSSVRQTPAELHHNAFQRGEKNGIELLKEAARGVERTPEEKLKDSKQVLAGSYATTELGRNSWDSTKISKKYLNKYLRKK